MITSKMKKEFQDNNYNTAIRLTGTVLFLFVFFYPTYIFSNIHLLHNDDIIRDNEEFVEASENNDDNTSTIYIIEGTPVYNLQDIIIEESADANNRSDERKINIPTEEAPHIQEPKKNVSKSKNEIIHETRFSLNPIGSQNYIPFVEMCKLSSVPITRTVLKTVIVTDTSLYNTILYLLKDSRQTEFNSTSLSSLTSKWKTFTRPPPYLG